MCEFGQSNYYNWQIHNFMKQHIQSTVNDITHFNYPRRGVWVETRTLILHSISYSSVSLQALALLTTFVND